MFCNYHFQVFNMLSGCEHIPSKTSTSYSKLVIPALIPECMQAHLKASPQPLTASTVAFDTFKHFQFTRSATTKQTITIYKQRFSKVQILIIKQIKQSPSLRCPQIANGITKTRIPTRGSTPRELQALAVRRDGGVLRCKGM